MECTDGASVEGMRKESEATASGRMRMHQFSNESTVMRLSILDEAVWSALSNAQVILFAQDRALRYTWIVTPHIGRCAQEKRSIRLP